MSAISDFYDHMHGVVFPFTGDDAPDGFLMCDGGLHDAAIYPALFAVTGNKYNLGGEAAGYFRVPDLRGRVIAGRDDMGGTAAHRLTGAGSGVNGAVLGSAGGAETHTLTEAQIPAHTHTANVTDPGHVHEGANTGDVSDNLWVPTGAFADGRHTSARDNTMKPAVTGVTVDIDDTGGGGAHNNTQPTLILNYIIKT